MLCHYVVNEKLSDHFHNIDMILNSLQAFRPRHEAIPIPRLKKRSPTQLEFDGGFASVLFLKNVLDQEIAKESCVPNSD